MKLVSSSIKDVLLFGIEFVKDTISKTPLRSFKQLITFDLPRIIQIVD